MAITAHPHTSYVDIAAQPFNLAVSKGLVTGHTYLHKFGAVPSMSIAATGTIWDVNDTVYPWASFTTAGTLTAPVVVAGDNTKTMKIYGLDASYALITETITLSSSTPVVTAASFIRVFRAHMVTEDNVGDVTLTKGGVVVLKMLLGNAQSMMAIYTVAAGYTGYLLQGSSSVESGGDATVHMHARFTGTNVFRTGHSFEVTSGGPYIFSPAIPFMFPEKTDIDVHATVRSNNSRVTAAFDLLLVANS